MKEPVKPQKRIKEVVKWVCSGRNSILTDLNTLTRKIAKYFPKKGAPDVGEVASKAKIQPHGGGAYSPFSLYYTLNIPNQNYKEELADYNKKLEKYNEYNRKLKTSMTKKEIKEAKAVLKKYGRLK